MTIINTVTILTITVGFMTNLGVIVPVTILLTASCASKAQVSGDVAASGRRMTAARQSNTRRNSCGKVAK